MTTRAEAAEELWLREYLPDHAALVLEGGPIDELMWLYQVAMNPALGCYHLVEGVIKPDLSLIEAPEIRGHYLARYDQIVTILEAAKVPFVKLPELRLTAKPHGYDYPQDPRAHRGFHDWEARVRVKLFHRR